MSESERYRNGVFDDGYILAAAIFHDLSSDDMRPSRDEVADFLLVDQDAVDRVNLEFVTSFVEAAVAVWEEIKNKILVE